MKYQMHTFMVIKTLNLLFVFLHGVYPSKSEHLDKKFSIFYTRYIAKPYRRNPNSTIIFCVTNENI